jgi:DNA-binding transcriptional LysR family regulator
MNWEERIGRRLKLRDLHILFAVVQCGSMTKAASQLSVSKPVVSKAVADLEHTLAVRLLDRGPQGIVPTVYGKALLDRGLGAFDELRRAVKDIESLSDPTTGEVRVATSIAIAAGFVSTVIARLTRRYPRISVELLAGEISASHRALEERRADLAILRLHAPILKQHLQTETLYDDSYVVVAGARTPWVRRRRIELADLITEPWALPPPDSLLGSVFVEAFRSRGLDYPRATVSTHTMPARAALAATGQFFSILPGSALKFSTANAALKALPIDLPTTRRPTGILTYGNRTLSPAAQLFIDCARAVVKPVATSARR